MKIAKKIAIRFFAVAAALLFVQYASAWSGPSSVAPNGNTSAPVNVGSSAQAKSGRLQLGTGGDGWESGFTVFSNYPTLYLRDTDSRSAMIHLNGGLLYFLRGCDAATSNPGVGNNWCAFNNMWPLVINLENNGAAFGGTVTANSSLAVTGQLCLNGSCISAWPAGIGGNVFGGMYAYGYYGCTYSCSMSGCSWSPYSWQNPYTNACSCPSWAPYARVIGMTLNYHDNYWAGDGATVYCTSL